MIANFDLSANAPVDPKVRMDYYHYIPNEKMSSSVITDFAEGFWSRDDRVFREDYITLIIDECQLLFNSRLWNSNGRMAYLEFLSQSRKYGIKVILIAQATKMIDNQFRMLIEVEHNHRRITSMGPIGSLLSAPLRGRVFLEVRYLYQCSERLGMGLLRASRKDMRMYDSYARFERQDV